MSAAIKTRRDPELSSKFPAIRAIGESALTRHSSTTAAAKETQMKSDDWGRSLRRFEDFRFLTGQRPVCRRFLPAEPGLCSCSAVAACPCRDRADRYGGGAQRQRRPRSIHRSRSARRRGRAVALHRAGQHGRPDDRAAALCAGARAGAPCRRSGGAGRRRKPRPGARRRRADRGRIPAARRGGRCYGGAAARGADNMGRGSRQSLLPISKGETGMRPEAAFAGAAHIVEIELVNNRARAGADRAAGGDRQL